MLNDDYRSTDYCTHFLPPCAKVNRIDVRRGRLFRMSTNDGREHAELPEAIVEAFRQSPLMSLPRVAKLLGMDRDTLREYVRAGKIPSRQKGFGKVSPRLVFILSDVAILLSYMQRQPIPARTWAGGASFTSKPARARKKYRTCEMR